MSTDTEPDYNQHLYRYGAYVTKVYDGDTITVDLDLGFDLKWRNQKIRLYGIDAPEVRGDERPAGLDARDYLRALLLDRWIIIRTSLDRSGKYGRLLGTIYYHNGNNWVLVNQHLIDKGHAEFNVYGDRFTDWPAL